MDAQDIYNALVAQGSSNYFYPNPVKLEEDPKSSLSNVTIDGTFNLEKLAEDLKKLL